MEQAQQQNNQATNNSNENNQYETCILLKSSTIFFLDRLKQHVIQMILPNQIKTMTVTKAH
jgi:hypothetical protein